MQKAYRNHRLLILNTASFFTIGLLLSYLLDHIAYALLSLGIGALLGWLGETLLKALKIPERRYLRVTLIFLIAEALLFIYGGIPAIGAYGIVHPIRLPIEMEPDTIGHPGKEITFQTRDGLTIAGWYYPSNNGAAIVTVHGLNGNRTHPIHQAKILVDNGYGVLTFDLRAHGESGGQLFTGMMDIGLDVQGAVDFIQSQPEVDQDRIGALGLSVGANAILFASAQGAPIQALIADGTGMARTEDALEPMLPEIRPVFFGTPLNRNYHLFIDVFSQKPPPPPVKEIVPKIAPRPILFIAGEAEWLEPALAQRYAVAAGENASVWLAPGATHLSAIFDHPKEYGQRMLSFYDEYLLGDESTDHNE